MRIRWIVLGIGVCCTAVACGSQNSGKQTVGNLNEHNKDSKDLATSKSVIDTSRISNDDICWHGGNFGMTGSLAGDSREVYEEFSARPRDDVDLECLIKCLGDRERFAAAHMILLRTTPVLLDTDRSVQGLAVAFHANGAEYEFTPDGLKQMWRNRLSRQK
jgi:hypothetical protein